MPTQPLLTYVAKSPAQVKADYLRTIYNGLIRIGVVNPNVGPNSDEDVRATALSNEIAVCQATAIVQADANMPDTATGAQLDRWGAIVGLQRRGPVGSVGLVTITCSVASTLVVTGTQLNDTAGLLYQVTVGGTYANGAVVPVQAISTGAATNHANGDTLKWVVGPAYCSQNATVGTVGGSDGLVDGADSEVGNDEPFRARILARLQNPPGGGNWSQVASWAAASSSYVQSAYVYPALNGPATVYFAVAGSPQTVAPFSSTSKNRDIPGTIVNGTIVPYVQGLLPEHAYSIGMSVANSPTDVAVLLYLPAAPTASPPGPGGGWIDGSPWPGNTTPCVVSGVTSSTVITVTALTPPTDGVSHVSWLSPLTWTLSSATVLSHTGVAGAYVLTLDTPFVGIANGNYIFPTSLNQQNYVNALLSAFALMGPGEWSGNPSALLRGYRHPGVGFAWPSALGAAQLRQIINAGPEVLDAAWLSRSQTTPAVPGALTSPPNILTPRNISFHAGGVP